MRSTDRARATPATSWSRTVVVTTRTRLGLAAARSAVARNVQPSRTVTATPPIIAKGGMSSASSAAAARTSGTMAGPARMTAGTSALMPHGLAVGVPFGEHLDRPCVARRRQVEGGGHRVDQEPAVVATLP